MAQHLKEIELRDTLNCIGKDRYEDYVAHAMCMKGSCKFIFNGKPYLMNEGDLIIIRLGRLFGDVEPSSDFEVRNLMVASSFINLSAPQNNYGTKGQIALFMNPVMHLTPEQRFVCERDFRWIDYRLSQTSHSIYQELVMNAFQALILDFFDFHMAGDSVVNVSTQNALLMNRFIEMLENGEYRRNREVKHYADVLCVTPKYLSEVTKKVSGCPANYWINRYTALDIARLLRDKNLTLVNISDIFNFSSPAYFSRYVQRVLGMNPTQYRD